jgi:Flp pilus assembly protein TadG
VETGYEVFAVCSGKTDGRKRTLRERGQALVEFALVVPILLILAFGIADFGMGFKTSITVTNATREGARLGAVGWPAGSYPGDCRSDPPTTDAEKTIVRRVCNALAVSQTALDQDVTNVSVSFVERNGLTGMQTGDSVVVSLSYRYDFITPLGAMLSTFSWGATPTHVTLSSTTDMRLE